MECRPNALPVGTMAVLGGRASAKPGFAGPDQLDGPKPDAQLGDGSVDLVHRRLIIVVLIK